MSFIEKLFTGKVYFTVFAIYISFMAKVKGVTTMEDRGYKWQEKM